MAGRGLVKGFATAGTAYGGKDLDTPSPCSAGFEFYMQLYKSREGGQPLTEQSAGVFSLARQQLPSPSSSWMPQDEEEATGLLLPSSWPSSDPASFSAAPPPA